ncbi:MULTISPECIES: M4 family metallopeptidase [unclassified Microbacterium]|uniref:M4 family metallopeptidase n=1 Tax=unclassified Microbacterium TaxID=2609290 RepID=UPI0012FAE5A2|nr:M4 family metallopeptidase [Microbacterium sp. MAH-37]MVQ42679.1 M4 family peptidase [Microbacterium sp. MAH-37]
MSRQRTRLIAVTSAFGVAASLAIAPVAFADDASDPVDTPTTDTPSQVLDINAEIATTDAAEAATTYLADNKDAFGIDTSDVKVVGTTGSQGTETVRLQQTVNDVPVFGAQYLVHMKSDTDSTTILSTNGTYLTDLDVDTKADATAEQAAAQAEAYIREQLMRGKMVAGDPLKVETKSEGLVIVPDGSGALAYNIQVSTSNPDDGTPVIKNVYVDADTAWPMFALDAIHTQDWTGDAVEGTGVLTSGKKVPLQLTKNHDGQYLFLDQSRLPGSEAEVATFDGSKYEVTQLLGVWPASLTDIYNGPTPDFGSDATDAGLVDAHVNAGKVLDYYKSLGRDGLDGKGTDVTSVVGVTYYHQPYVNAFWDGKKMVYGSGDAEYKVMSSEIDVVGHEMTHGVIEHTANLVYAGQSGAMNEGIADYFGNALDVQESGTSMDDPNAGLLGEDLCRTLSPRDCALRDLADGRSITTYLGMALEQDNAGVHYNSTIFSGALWDIRKNIGGDKADALVYKALSEYMTPLDDFVAGRKAVEQAARDLKMPMGPIQSAFNKHGIKENWQQLAGDSTRLMKDIWTERTGPAAAGGWWVMSQTSANQEPYAIYSGRTDGTDEKIKISDALPDQRPDMPKRYNVLPATDGKNVAWWAWGSTEARLMIAPVDGSGEPKQIGFGTSPSFLNIDGDWVTWTSPVYGKPKQYYVNVNEPNKVIPVDTTYHIGSAYGSINDGRMVYMKSWPDAQGYHLNLFVRDLATGTETMLPEITPDAGNPNAGLYAPKALDDRIVLGADLKAGARTGIISVDWSGGDRKVIVDELSDDAPVLGGYEATAQAVTYEDWPGDMPPKVFQVGLEGGQVLPMSCATGMQLRVAADEGTRAVWLDTSYGDTSLVVRDKPRQQC